MQSTGFTTGSCFVCRKDVRRLITIEKTKVPSSKKPLKDVILHITNFMKVDIKVCEEDGVCQKCLLELVQYDECVLRLLSAQKRLMIMIEKWASGDACHKRKVYEKEIALRSCNIENIHIEKLEPEESSEEQLYTIAEIANTEFLADEDACEQNFLTQEANVEEIEQQQVNSMLPMQIFSCTVCEKKFKNQTRLNSHMSREHKRCDRAVCLECGAKCRDEEYLELHMNIHEGKTENECRFCAKRYSRKVNVIRHMHKHWDKKKFQCEKCGLRFSENTVLYNHRLQHEAEEQPLICEVCKQCFKTKRTYKQHLMTHREDRPRYSCQYCGKTFVEKYTLKVHLRTHEGGAEIVKAKKRNSVEVLRPQFECIICNCLLANKELYDQHMEDQHDVILKPIS